jgi:type I restriction-modification system DNA methylase subunit
MIAKKYLSHQNSIEENDVTEILEKAIKKAILRLGNAFLQHPPNVRLRQKIQNQEIKANDYYRDIYKFIYRILFLRILEEKNSIFINNKNKELNKELDKELDKKLDKELRDIYYRHYSVIRLFNDKEYYLSGERSRDTDIWERLLRTFELLSSENRSNVFEEALVYLEELSIDFLCCIRDCTIENVQLLGALKYLDFFIDEKNKGFKIDYWNIDVERLGSVYETLLDIHPHIQKNFEFVFLEGKDRKTTGSYYTPSELVDQLIQMALIPVIEAKIKGLTCVKDKAEAILSIKVCDPACGSGHILLAAARCLAFYYAQYRYETENASEEEYREALRKVIRRCIYGVDYNGDAVELCRFAFSLESAISGKPLLFIAHKIKVGNSLVGIEKLIDVFAKIPEEAYEAKKQDDENICRKAKKSNDIFFLRKRNLFSEQEGLIAPSEVNLSDFALSYDKINCIEQDTVAEVAEARKLYQSFLSSYDYVRIRTACDLWVTPFFDTYSLEGKSELVTSETVYVALREVNCVYRPKIEKARRLSEKLKFFHWFLEFPDVFQEGGFDVMLGNPPWEILELKEEEFFESSAPNIACVANASKRKKLIADLKDSANPSDRDLYASYIQEIQYYESLRLFLRNSQRFELTAVGRVNMYSLFAELFSRLINAKGRAGVIVPTGIATDDNNKRFFEDLFTHKRLAAIYDFQNREKLFRDVTSLYRFSLLTLCGELGEVGAPQFGFYLTNVSHLQDKRRVFALSAESIFRLNPNTHTCPIFRTRQDAQLTESVYKRIKVLIHEQNQENPWGVKLSIMFDMSSASHLFREKAELEQEGFALQGNRFIKGDTVYLPLYEAKMIWHYDHRFGSYAGVKSRSSTQIPTPALEQRQDPEYQILPWYWIDAGEVERKTKEKWLIGFRDIARSTDERTGIFSAIPFSGVGGTMKLLFSSLGYQETALLLSIFCSLVFDYFVRQKISNLHLSFTYIKQFPVLSPAVVLPYKAFILPRVLELTYTSWDMFAFALSLWQSADSGLKDLFLAQHKANQTATGAAHSFTPPNWSEAKAEDCPLPPFVWEEERREKLQAELDALFAFLYGLNRKQLRYILDPSDLTDSELADILSAEEKVSDVLNEKAYQERSQASDFPSETFRVLKTEEMKRYKEYRRRRLVLEAWEKRIWE